jgi:hypothetical protein
VQDEKVHDEEADKAVTIAGGQTDEEVAKPPPSGKSMGRGSLPFSSTGPGSLYTTSMPAVLPQKTKRLGAGAFGTPLVLPRY